MLHDLLRIGPSLALAIVATMILVWDFLPHDRPLPAPRGRPLMAVALLGPIAAAIWAGVLLANHERGTGFAGSVALDDFSYFFAFLFAAVVAAVILASPDYTARFEERQPEYFSLLLFATGAMTLLAASRDLVLIFITLELTSISQYILAAIQRDNRAAEAGVKYLLLGAVASAVILYGMALLFGLTGTTRLDGIAAALAGQSVQPALVVAAVFLIAGFGFKMAVVPFQMWVPDVYEGASAPVVAFLSVASKAAAFAIVLRVFFQALPDKGISGSWSDVFAVVAAISMSAGNLLALSQTNIKRLLGYSSIAQAGNFMVGLAAISAGGRLGMATGASSVMFFLAAYAATNLSAFIVVIAVSARTGSELIADYAGLARRAPLLAAALAFALISLTGIPPTAGFVAKLYVFNSAVESHLVWLVVIAVINSVVSAFYYLRIASTMFVGEPPSLASVPTSAALNLALAVAVAAVLFVGIVPTPLLNAAKDAAASLAPQ